MIQYKTGNLLDTPDSFIVHGCNAQGVMGSGVAKAIRDKYPAAYEDYKSAIANHPYGEKLLGKVYACVMSDDKVILNAITQEFYGKDGKKYVSYDAIDEAMGRVAKFTKKPISMPKIGAGLGGGSWRIIEAIIEARLPEHVVTVWELP